jgi:hypothetical protein
MLSTAAVLVKSQRSYAVPSGRGSQGWVEFTCFEHWRVAL